MDTTPADLLERAAEILEEVGWCQGSLVDAEGRICAAGALSGARQELMPSFLVMNAAWAALNRFVGVAVGLLPRWNDEEGRTEYEVIDALRHTAKELRNRAVA